MSIQQVSGQATGAQFGQITPTKSAAISYPHPTTSGNALVLLAASGVGPATLTVTDNYGNTWVREAQETGQYAVSWIFRCVNCRGGPGHVITISSANPVNVDIAIDEFFGMSQAAPTVNGATQYGNVSTPTFATGAGGVLLAVLSTCSTSPWVDPGNATVPFEATYASNAQAGIAYAFALTDGGDVSFSWTGISAIFNSAVVAAYYAPGPSQVASARVAAGAATQNIHQTERPTAAAGATGAPAVTHNVAPGAGALASSAKVIASEKTPATGRLSTAVHVVASEKSPAGASTRAAASAAVASNSAKGESHTGASANVEVTHNRTDAAAGLRASGVLAIGSGRIVASPETIASSLVDRLARLQTALKLVTDAANIALAGAVHSAGSAGPPAKAQFAAAPMLKHAGEWIQVQRAGDAQYFSSRVTLTFPNPVAAGNLLLAFVVAQGNSPAAPNLVDAQDSLGSAFSVFTTNGQAPSGNQYALVQMQLCLAVAASSGNDSFTIFWSNPADTEGVQAFVYEYQPPQPGIAIGQEVLGGGGGGSVGYTAGNVGGLAAGDLVLSAIFESNTPAAWPFSSIATGNAILPFKLDIGVSSGQSSLSDFFSQANGPYGPASFSVPVYAVGNAVASGAGKIRTKAAVATSAANISLSEHLSAAATKLLLSQVTHSESSLTATAFVSPGQAVEASIAAALRLIASSLYAAAGRIAANAGPRVTRNLASAESRAAATASELVSQVTATEGAIHASAGLTSSNIENVVSRVVASPAVLAGGVYHAAAGISAAPLLRTSSRYQARAGLAAIGKGRFVSGAGQVDADALIEVTGQFVHLTSGVATELKTIASQVVSASSEFSAAGHPHVATNLARLVEHAAGLASVVNHTSALAAGLLSSHAAERVASNLADAATSLAGAAVEIAKTSKSRPGATGGAVATVVASNPLRATTTTRARATLFASGQHVAAEAALAFDGVPRSSGSVHPLAEMRLDAIVLASGVKAIVSGVRAQLTTIASSLTAAAISVSNRARAGVTKNVTRPVSITAADAAQTVPHNAASVQTRAAAEASNRVPYNVARVSLTTAASAQPRVTANSCRAAEHLRASGVLDVLENHVSALEQLAFDGAAIALHNVADVSSRLRADAEQIVSQIVAALADLAADAQEHALHNLAHGQASLDALADLVNRTARAVEGGIIAVADPINHEFLSLAEHLESLAEAIAKTGSTGGSDGRGGAFATVIASSLFGGTAGVGAKAAVSSPNKQMAVAAWVYVEPLSPGNDSLCQLLGIQDEDGNYLTDEGPITCVVTDPDDNTVASLTLAYLGTPVRVAGRNFADGNWSATLAGSVPLAAGTTYCLTFQSSNPVLEVIRYETAQTRSA